MSKFLSVATTGCGKPVVLLHGWGMGASVFGSLRDHLRQRYRVYSVDLPGYGGSVWDGSLLFEEQVANIASQLPEAVLVGWSMGGLYAIEMAQQYPEKFKRLVLVASNPCFVRRPDWHCALDDSVFESFSRDVDAGKQWRTIMKRFITLQMLGGDNARQLIRQQLAEVLNARVPDIEALRFGLHLLQSRDMRPELARITVPIQMILGVHDALVPNETGREIGKVNPTIQVDSFSTAAHLPFLSHTEQLAAMI